MFLSLDFLYVPARGFEVSVRYYTGQLGGELGLRNPCACLSAKPE